MKLHFDLHAFAGTRARPVTAETGIAYEDYARMQTRQRKQSGERRLGTPDWAVNDAALRELLVAYMEKRAGVPRGTGTLSQRLARAKQAVMRQRAKLNDILDRLARKYVSAKRPRRKRALAIEIEGIDTAIRISENGAAVVAAIVYLYFRVGLDSPGVAEILRLKPPHVRVVLWRMRRIAQQFSACRPQKSGRNIPRTNQRCNHGYTALPDTADV